MDDDHELTPEQADEAVALDKKLLESETFVQELLRKGWVHSKDNANTISHPDDPTLTVWKDPYSGETLLSAKLVEQIKHNLSAKGEAHDHPTDEPANHPLIPAAPPASRRLFHEP